MRDSKTSHWIAEPHVPRFGIVCRHPELLLSPGLKLIEKVSVHTDSSRDDEIARVGLRAQIRARDLPQCDPPRTAAQGSLGRRWYMQRQAQIVGQRVGGSHGQNPKGNGSLGQRL